MIPVIEARQWARRVQALDTEVEARARAIVAGVAAGGDEAVLDYTERFDCVQLSQIGVPANVLARAWEDSSADLRRIISDAASNIRRFHEHQLQHTWYVDDGEGVRLGQRLLPVERVGLYAPGGTAAYPSSVLMTAIPAQVAGVGELHLVSPPQESGLPHPAVMGTAHFLGVDHVYAIGGAQAIAALAFGTSTVPRVDMIAGPGSAYVTAAKKAVFGQVDIDSLAGPSEIVILADDSARPDWVAHDLLAQAEHDERASAILVTFHSPLVEAVCAHVERLIPSMPRSRILRAALSDNGLCIVSDTLEEALETVNAIAPEHLELMVKDPWAILEKVRHAGAVFVGSWSPEPVGDYYAGPNHVLPTGGTARFASALGVDNFVRRQSIIAYSKERLLRTARDIAVFARSEALEAHARSVEVRVEQS